MTYHDILCTYASSNEPRQGRMIIRPIFRNRHVDFAQGSFPLQSVISATNRNVKKSQTADVEPF